MSVVRRIVGTVLGLFLVWSGAFKFTGGHVFQYIEYQSGIELFHPLVNNATGIAEILVGLMILFGRTRFHGSVLAAGIMAGAVGFHLSPWLGVSVPTGLVGGAAAPWGSADFTATTSPAAFVMAVITGAVALAVAVTEHRTRVAINSQHEPPVRPAERREPIQVGVRS